MIYQTVVCISSLLMIIHGQNIPSIGFLLNYLGDPESYQCSSNNTQVCEAVEGFTCLEGAGFCVPGCSVAEDCQRFGNGTGLTQCTEGQCLPSDVCASDSDCPTLIGFTCDTSTGECVPPTGCTSNDECTTPGVGVCNLDGPVGLCIIEMCETTSDCVTDGYVCQPEAGVCIESCNTNNICSTLLTCNSDSGICEIDKCSDDSDCGGYTNACFNTTCIPGCSTDADCKGLIPGTICQPTPLNISQCIPGIISPVGCKSDSDCSGTTPNCNADLGICYAGCTTTNDCDTGEECITDGISGVMVCAEIDNVESCANGGSCSKTGYKCNSYTGFCYPACETKEDCNAIFGFDAPCKTQKYGVGSLSYSVKYCDVTQTPAPTMSPTQDSAPNFKVVSVIMCIVGFLSLIM